MDGASLHDEATWRRARRKLLRSDPVLAEVIRRQPVLTPPPPHHSRFALLAHSILSQQISVKAAATIRRRLSLRLGNKWTPSAVLALEDADFQACGVSRQKRGYLRDLARKEADGVLRLRGLHRRSDQEVIDDLTRIKGVGRWTAEMFLIFVLGRPDVLSVDDLGLQNAVRRFWDLDERPDPESFHRLAMPWRPWRSVASWYLWSALGGPDLE